MNALTANRYLGIDSQVNLKEIFIYHVISWKTAKQCTNFPENSSFNIHRHDAQLQL